ncbi:MAG: diguanylate cyclase, partial [Chitinivibrionales bacterium]|nr:diguanylate cyclase [Chitinivibrionales bacterium]MBD3394716.1 diguanylate cyclase [Chitinivibrionales bacterium]
MKQNPIFDGFDRIVRGPLERSDPLSFNRVKRLLDENREENHAPVAFIIQRLCGKSLEEADARGHWKRILDNKLDMETKLGRRVALQTAMVDHFSRDGRQEKPRAKRRSPPARDEWIDRIYAPEYHVEKLREEVQRARRYNHALSAMMIDLDDFSDLNQQYSYSTGDEILALTVKILRKSVRNVDIVSRYSGDVFLVIL